MSGMIGGHHGEGKPEGERLRRATRQRAQRHGIAVQHRERVENCQSGQSSDALADREVCVGVEGGTAARCRADHQTAHLRPLRTQPARQRRVAARNVRLAVAAALAAHRAERGYALNCRLCRTEEGNSSVRRSQCG
eukprot:scaffold269526_cov30-Tisochrysis_lutea.AAC.1